MLDGLWNIDKHRVVNFPNMDVTMEGLSVVRLRDDTPVNFDLHSLGPRRLSLAAFDGETHLARLRMRDPGPPTRRK
jgi:hypothetical protein